MSADDRTGTANCEGSGTTLTDQMRSEDGTSSAAEQMEV
jgi:hypothetical protein